MQAPRPKSSAMSLRIAPPAERPDRSAIRLRVLELADNMPARRSVLSRDTGIM